MNVRKLVKDANENAESLKATAISSVQDEIDRLERIIIGESYYVKLGRLAALCCRWDERTRSFSLVIEEQGEIDFIKKMIDANRMEQL